MATLQRTRPKQKPVATSATSASEQSTSSKSSETVTPKKTILPTAVRTESASAVLMKRLLAASISTICYLRGLFAPGCFIDKRLPGKSVVKVLTTANNGKLDRDAVALLQILQGAFDALDKKYLRALLFGISCNRQDLDVVDEFYTFSFEYGDDGEPLMSIVDSKGEVKRRKKKVSYAATKQSVVEVMRKLSSMAANLEGFRIKPNLSIKLLYYDERTPADYDPPGFAPGARDHFAMSGPIKVEAGLGEIDTNFHSVNFGVRSILGAIEGMEEVAE